MAPSKEKEVMQKMRWTLSWVEHAAWALRKSHFCSLHSIYGPRARNHTEPLPAIWSYPLLPPHDEETLGKALGQTKDLGAT